jgi:FkbM family methyltransferase
MSLNRRATRLIRNYVPDFLFNYSWRLKRHIADAMFIPRTVHHAYGGLPLAIRIEDRIAKDWYDCDCPELREIKLLSTGNLCAGATVFDIGAHQSVVAMVLANVVGPTGKIIAVEANAHCVEVSRENLRLNNVTNVHLVHAAAGASPGVLHFSEDSLHVDRDEKGQDKKIVKATTVDALAEEFGIPEVLFIDVEGYECEVLRGAKMTMKSRPNIFIEVHTGVGLEDFGGSVAAIMDLIPPDTDIYVAAPHHGEFVTLPDSGEITTERFFLISKT